MTRSSTAAIDIAGRRHNSDGNNIDDMSFINSFSYDEIMHHDVSNQMTPIHAAQSSSKDSLLDKVPLIPGEKLMKDEVCQVDGGNLMLTNYRLVFLTEQKVYIFTLMELELTDFRDPDEVIISMKGGRVQRFLFDSYEKAVAWHRQLTKIVTRINRGNLVNNNNPSEEIEVFAWSFSKAVDADRPPWLKSAGSVTPDVYRVDFDRLNMADAFRISDVNRDFQLCETYPEKIIVPRSIDDDVLKNAASYRALNRFPAVVWRNKANNAVLLRSAQPQVGFLSWRNNMDEKLIEAVVEVTCKPDEEKKQFIIMDARTYATAFANRARSGGFENTENYQQAKMDFLGLPNIHTVRNSFVAMRNLLHSGTHETQLLRSLQNTGWLQYLSNLLCSSASCADYLANGHSVLVHCSDGWDRTTQIVSLAKLMLDEYYRTIHGFEELIRREWLAFGHKFNDRQQSVNGNWDAGERSPIFLQFLEAVRHLQREQPTAFQFTHAYLLKLAQHAYSGLFGTFLFNSQKEREQVLKTREASLVEIWRFVGDHNEEFVNQSFNEEHVGALRSMSFSVINLRVWHEVFADDVERYTKLYNASKESAERPSSGCGAVPIVNNAGLVKSKSSESVSSINIDANSSQMNIAMSPTENVTAESFCHSNSPPISHSYHQATIGAAWGQRDAKIEDILDFDGLVKHHDEEQATQRRKRAELTNEIRRNQCIIHDLKNRQRSLSQESSESPLERINGSLKSVDTDDMIEKMSDVSVVNPNEVPKDGSAGWQLKSDKCSLCDFRFQASIYREHRMHHCRKCGCIVCEQCSQNRYHETVEGKGEIKRCCNECYSKMQPSGIITTCKESPEEFGAHGVKQAVKG